MRVALACLLLAFVILGAVGAPSSGKGFLSHLHHLRLRPPPPPTLMSGVRAPTSHWFNQYLDHSDPSGTTLWKQLYFKNTQFYKQGGPVFVFIGGEGPASAGWLQGGQMVELAILHNAAMYNLEHRFYGVSEPTPDISVKNLKYLSAEQALADLAVFLEYIRYYEYPTGKVVVFGGSYAGNLAAWARLKYPNLIDAAVASSAPVLAQVDFPEYYEVVATAMYNSSRTCLDNIRQASDAVTSILLQPGGADTISEMFNFCTPLDMNKKQDVSNFYSSFAGVYAGVVQYASNLEEVASWCSLMTDPSYGETPLDRYIYLSNSYIAGGGCLDVRYELYIDYYSQTSWNSNAASSGSRQWIYQTCTEYGYYQTSSSSVQPFGDFFDVNYYLQYCPDFYDSSFTPSFVYGAADRTNMKYGGLTPQVDKVVFVHGSIDPWHTLGILKDLSADAPVVMIEGVAHCADMSSSSGSDSFELSQGKSKVAQYVAKWLA